MDPLDFLKNANSLMNSTEEAGRRSAVSRAYYDAFHYIRLYLIRESIDVPKDATAHEKLPKYLRNSGLENAKYVGQRLGELKDDRWDADYKIAIEDLRRREETSVLERFNSGTCVLLVLKADLVIRDFNSCKGKELINGIKKYITEVERGLPS